MNAHSKDRKTFQLTDNDQLLGELIYEHLFDLKAEIKLPDTEVYHLAPVGFFGTSIVITKDGNKVASLAMNWKGQIIITFQNDRAYALKLNGLFHNRFILENREQESVLQLEPKFNWKQFHYNFDISYDITNDNEPKDKLLLLLTVYAANFFISAMSGANAGRM